MSEQHRIFCTLEPQAKAFSKDGLVRLSTALAFDWTGDEGDGKQEFACFLKKVPGYKFALCRIDISDLKNPEVKSVDEIKEIAKPKGNDHEILVNWIKLRKKPEPFWSSSSEIDQSIKSEHLRATHLLRSAAQWIAPVPQKLGLRRLFKLDTGFDPDLAKDEVWVLLPFSSDPPDKPFVLEPDSSVSTKGEQSTLIYDLDQVNGKDRRTIVADTWDGKPEEVVEIVDAASGLLKLSDASIETINLLEAYREKAHGLNWATPKLLQPSVVEHIYKDEGGTAISRKQAAGNLLWLATSAMVSIIDPIILALTMPGMSEDNPVEGGLLKHLVDAVLVAILAESDHPDNEAYSAQLQKLNDENILAGLRDSLDQSPLCDGKRDLKAISSLAKAIGKEDLKDTTPLLPTLLVLVKDFDENKIEDQLVKLENLTAGRKADKNGKAANPFEELAGFVVEHVNDLALELSEDSGAEKAALRILKSVLYDNGNINSLVAKNLADATGELVQAKKDEISAILKTALHNAMVAFEAFLETEFDGSEAIRQSNAVLFVWAMSFGEKGKLTDPESLRKTIRKAKFLEHRWESIAVQPDETSSQDAVRKLAEKLWRLDISANPTPQPDLLEAFSEQVEAGIADIIDVVRFVPDRTPQPLPIQIAKNSDPSQIVKFNQAYGGLGVLIQAYGDGNEWTTPNLASLEVMAKPSPGDEWLEAPVINPIKPTINDGVSRAFVGYEGVPFSSTVFRDTLTAGLPDEVPTEFQPFYTLGEFEGAPGTVPLAYGVSYEVVEFALSHGLSLPAKFQENADEPWKLKNPIEHDPKVGDDGLVATYQYCRRTAIGRTHINETGKRRVGEIRDGIFPLAFDYPRKALNGDDFFELGRRANGQGGFQAAADAQWDRVPLVLTNLRSKSGAKLIVEIVAIKKDKAPDEDIFASMEVPIKAGEKNHTLKISLKFEPEIKPEPGRTTLRTELNGTDIQTSAVYDTTLENWWVRVKTESGECVSFDAPVGDSSRIAETADASDKPVLLIGPEGEFDEKFTDAAKLEIGFPRVTFDDCARWLNNPDLNKDLGLKEGLEDTLWYSRIVRTASESLGNLLDKVPDPAVEGLLLELIPLDSLNDETPAPVVKYIERRSYDDVEIHDPQDTKPPEKFYEETLNSLDRLFTDDLLVKCTGSALKIESNTPDKGKRRTITLTIPQGVVAEFRVRPAVKRNNFYIGKFGAAPLHGGLMQLTNGDWKDGGDDLKLFGGDGMIIEAMLAGLPEGIDQQIEDRLAIKSAGAARTYDLQIELLKDKDASLKKDNAWRQLGLCKVRTQRWTTSGRPIYSWIEPDKLQRNDNSNAAAMELVVSPASSHEIHRFETEAFFDRSDDDESIYTVKLDPLAHNQSSKLQSIISDDPTATYFRHRITGISRYKEAHKANFRKEAIINSWNDELPGNKWLRRIVMLADAKRLDITRPQQRALVPLTSAPATGEGQLEEAPPIVAMLQERPYAVGGLADRIAAEIKTGYGYHVVKDAGGKKKLAMKDARKEIGPDPRLRQSTFPPPDGNLGTDPAIGMALQVEGPIGLTFDPDIVAKPGFANCTLSIVPADYSQNGLDRNRFAETFMGISLFRYLHPSWTYDAGPAVKADNIERACWIEFDDSGALKIGDVKVGELTKSSSRWKVCVSRPHINPAKDEDGELIEKPGLLEICRVPTEHFGRLAILHQPLDDNRYLMSIFGVPARGNMINKDKGLPDAILQPRVSGFGNQPVLLATVRWAKSENTTPISVTGYEADPGLRNCIASEPTFMEWTRTGRNFSVLSHFAEEDGVHYARDISYDQLEAQIAKSADTITIHRCVRGKKNGGESLWVRPAQQSSPPTQYVHRYMAAIITEPSGGTGVDKQIFAQAIRAESATLALPAGKQLLPGGKLHLVELETPAWPLGLASISGSFDKVDLDLKSLLSPSPDSVALLICGRFLTPLSGIEWIKFSLSDSSYRQQMNPVDFALDVSAVSDPVAFEIVIEKGKVQTFLIDATGGKSDGTEATLDGWNSIDQDSFWQLSISELDPKIVATEFWCDISLRVIKTRKDDPVNLNAWPLEWLFSDLPDGNAERAQAVLPEQLHKMTEAQARIVAISPPISMVITRK